MGFANIYMSNPVAFRLYPLFFIFNPWVDFNLSISSIPLSRVSVLSPGYVLVVIIDANDVIVDYLAVFKVSRLMVDRPAANVSRGHWLKADRRFRRWRSPRRRAKPSHWSTRLFDFATDLVGDVVWDEVAWDKVKIGQAGDGWKGVVMVVGGWRWSRVKLGHVRVDRRFVRKINRRFWHGVVIVTFD